jgi:hypothetical protein
LQSHVMNLKKYLTIMWQKVMDREVIKLIRKIILKKKKKRLEIHQQQWL